MTEMSIPAEWERWRGEIDAHIRECSEQRSNCSLCRDNVNGKVSTTHLRIDDLAKDIANLRVRVAYIAGASAGLGGVVGGLVAKLL